MERIKGGVIFIIAGYVLYQLGAFISNNYLLGYNEFVITKYFIGCALSALSFTYGLYLIAFDEKKPTKTTHGSAKWATKKDLKKLLNSDSRFVLGKAYNQKVRYKGNSHLLTVAPTRTGKGTCAIIPNLLRYESSVFVIDPKGENASVTANRRRAMGQEVYILDPWAIVPNEISATFNPLSFLESDSSDLEENAKLIADTLVYRGDKNVDPHWNDEALTLITGFILHVVKTYPEEQRTLMKVRDLISAPSKELAETLYNMSKSKHKIIARAAISFLDKPEKEAGSVLSNARKHTEFIDNRHIESVMGNGTPVQNKLNLSDLKKKNISVYLVLPPEHLSTFSRWLRLLIGLAIKSMSNTKHKTNNPVLFILDEFAVLGHLKTIEQAVGLMAGYGVQLWTILQDLSQLQDIYPDLWKSFISNAGVLQTFGTADIDTAEYISKMIGVQTIEVNSTSETTDYRDHKQTGTGNYSTGRSLMMPEEILNLPPYKQILFIRNYPPILADKLKYYEDKELEGSYGKNPFYF